MNIKLIDGTLHFGYFACPYSFALTRYSPQVHVSTCRNQRVSVAEPRLLGCSAIESHNASCSSTQNPTEIFFQKAKIHEELFESLVSRSHLKAGH